MDYPKRARTMSDGGASGGPSKFGLVADYRDDDSDGHSGTPGSRGPAVVIRSPPRPSQLPFSDALRCTASPLAGALPPVVTSVAEEPPRPYPATADSMADEDSSLAAAPAPLNLASLPAPLTAAAALPAAAPRAYPRLAALPPEPDEDPPPAVMEKMRQFWAATSKARPLPGSARTAKGPPHPPHCPLPLPPAPAQSANFTSRLRQHKEFNNPYILDRVIETFAIDQYGALAIEIGCKGEAVGAHSPLAAPPPCLQARTTRPSCSTRTASKRRTASNR